MLGEDSIQWQPGAVVDETSRPIRGHGSSRTDDGDGRGFQEKGGKAPEEDQGGGVVFNNRRHKRHICYNENLT